MDLVHVLRGQAGVINATLKACLDRHSIVVHVPFEVRVVESCARALDHFLHWHVASIWIGVLLGVLSLVRAAPVSLPDSIWV